MVDKITLDRIELLRVSLKQEAKDIYRDICKALNGRAICRFAHTYRSNKEQDALYAKGRTSPGKIVTNSRGSESYHNYGLAIDIVLLKDKNGDGTFETASWETNVDFDGDGVADWMEIVKIFKSYGWEWGGDWKFTDMPHFQKTYGLSIKQLQFKTKNLGGSNFLI